MNTVTCGAWRLLVLGTAISCAAEAAAGGCDAPLARSIQATKTLWSARPEGNSDIHGELQLIDEACARGKDVEAAWRLEQIQRRLADRRSAPARLRCQAGVRLSNSCSLVADARIGRRTLNVDPTPSTLSALTSP